ncbi:hypothetical protein EB796_017345 [Bugula neritina]|uniref:Uncharacterized protein n=1 Tax=Bugula neritina TaxID=10212 RepID=A0A7J7JFE0_BUGNE|nr:hypothetical protein EB796_017345 [Bugula neritina]
MAEAAVPSEPRKKAGKERGIEDYRRKIWKLKKDLEEQRELSLKVQQDELEKLRQVWDYKILVSRFVVYVQ